MTRSWFRVSPRLTLLVSGLLLLLMGGITGCGDDAPQTGHVTLSAMSKPSGSALTTGTNGFLDVVLGNGPDSLRITRVEFVLGEIELAQAESCSSAADDDEDEDSHGNVASVTSDDDSASEDDASENGCELELNPLLVDLPLDVALPVQVLDAAVPSGTYTRLEAEVRPVTEDEHETGAAEFLAAHPDWAGLSVRVAGVYTDRAGVPHDFIFTSDVEAQIELPFASPVTVDAGSQNLTLVVDVASWFVDDGDVLDPRNRANRTEIKGNIRDSFQAFEDDDEDGHDDDHSRGD